MNRKRVNDEFMKKIYSKKIFIVILLGIILSFGYVAYSATNVNLEVTPNPSENNIRLDWSMTDIQNYSFKIYQKKPGSSSFQTISAVDFNNVQEIVNVLNIYPGLGDTITFTTYDGETMRPVVCDIPGKDEYVQGVYEIPSTATRIKIKITDLLSESLELEV